MKNYFILAASLMIGSFAAAQELDYKLDNYYAQTKGAINTFEVPKDTVSTFDKVKVNLGGAFALQYQAIDHENSGAAPLYDIGNNFNLAVANLDLNVGLYDGMTLHLRTFLSSRHHPEAYVKGGYLQIDKLDFIEKDFLKSVMDYTTIKFGHNEINYGDAHFRRSDNANAITNPFVGNLIMDAYATMVFGEFYYQRNGWIAMLGVTNGRLNQNANTGTSPSVYGKIGYDKQVSEDLRFRLTGSVYNSAQTMRTDFYDGDRAGSRYYFVMEDPTATSKDNFRSGQIVPGFTNKLTAYMFNPFLKYKGFEFFGVYETTNGQNLALDSERRTFNQYSAELLYRFGKTENFYVGGRYNYVEGEMAGADLSTKGDDIEVTRFNIGGGWFMTKNVMVKLEYVNQKYDGYSAGSKFNDGKFNGFVAEAVIAF